VAQERGLLTREGRPTAGTRSEAHQGRPSGEVHGQRLTLAPEAERLTLGWWVYKQHLDNLRRKDSLRGAETTEISVRLKNDSASHFEGSAYT